MMNHPTSEWVCIRRLTGCWGRLALLSVLAALTGCSRPGGNHAVVGTWADSIYGEQLVEFKADGTIAFDLDVEKARARLLAKHPQRADTVDGTLARMRQTVQAKQGSWWAAGEMYRVKLPGPEGKMASGRMKIDGDRLVPCKRDGTAVQGLSYVRRTQ